MSIEGTIPGNVPRELEPGAEFAGHQIVRILGRGGMGIVYLAREPRLDRLVALKLIRPDLAHDATFRARFRSESRTAAAIENPHVVTVFGAGERDGLLYVAMRYVPGRDLGRIVTTDGPLSPEIAAGLIDQVAAGLDAVHAAGLVHRDVKPGNVIVGDEAAGGGRAAYLADFGLAKAIAASSGLTATGELIGTLDFIAPEQIEGRRVDARTDVYALGCVLFHAVTGRVPFSRPESSAKMWAHLSEPPPAPAPRAAALEPVIGRAMAKDPADRFPSAGDLGRAATAAVRDEAVTEPERVVGAGEAAPTEALPPDTAPTRKLPRKRRRRGPLAVGAIALIAAFGAAAAIEVPRLKDDGGGTPPAKPAGVEVPSLAGERLDLAERHLDELGLRSTERGGGLFGVVIASDWAVCQTDPAAGASVRPGSTVTLLIDRPGVC
jgi:serine/threonine protein kinase